MRSLDPSFLESEWAHRQDTRAIYSASEFLLALGWLALCVPIIQLVWILSKGGRKRIGMHLLICALAVAGSITELLSRLMVVGVQNASEWVAREFNLDRWLSSGEDDGLGWRTLEVVHILTRSIALWVDAFNWLALSGILITLYCSMRKDKEGNAAFGRRWSILGLVIGVLSFLDFLTYVLRYEKWVAFWAIALVLSTLNSLLLLPIWLIVVGLRLPKASEQFESDAFPGESDAFVGGNEQGFNDEQGVEFS
eukprot:CAMPEP_0185728292 /NCGR_PEP_ID=MMETSP1171-20130828/3684_1 /TAXON_ID=374046 /ORGANISM="Helicotheca tamensis, Strain CCMP826" /LENGTH=251 /DNA_ID=CAMNT_0028396983 /DNA_START=292 /DNA_END=1047 /DNA_ORIENTATION=-